jgi:hypothetical protein
VLGVLTRGDLIGALRDRGTNALVSEICIAMCRLCMSTILWMKLSPSCNGTAYPRCPSSIASGGCLA